MNAALRALRRWALRRRLAHAEDVVWAETQALLAALHARRRAKVRARALAWALLRRG
jgi:hypothetical protein